MYCIAEVIQSIFHNLVRYTIYKNIKSLCYWRERGSSPRWRVQAASLDILWRLRNCGGPAEHCTCASRGPGLVSRYFVQDAYRRARPRRRRAALLLCHGQARCVRVRGENCGTAAVSARRERCCGCRAGQKGISVSAVPSLLGSSSRLSARAMPTLGSVRAVWTAI